MKKFFGFLLVLALIGGAIGVGLWAYNKNRNKGLFDDDDPETYNVTYVLNGATNNEQNPTIYTTGTEIILLSPTFDNIHFIGWYTSETFDESTRVGKIEATQTGDLTFYARFETFELSSDSKTLNSVTKWGKNLKTLVVPSTVESYNENAFKNNANVETVDLSETIITTINENDFVNCYNLKSISFPKTLVTLEAGAFKGCKKIETISVHEDNGNFKVEKDALYRVTSNAGAKREVELIVGTNKCNEVPYWMFIKGASFVVRTIANYAFNGMGIVSIDINESVRSIGGSAFQNCTKLKNLEISKVTSESSTDANNGLIVGKLAFYNTTSLTKLILPNETTIVEESAFEQSGITELEVQSSSTTLGKAAFKNCTNLTTCDIEKAKVIGEQCFMGCTKIASLTVMNGIDGAEDSPAKIGSYAFKGCTSLTSLTIYSKCREIGQHILDGLNPNNIKVIIENKSNWLVCSTYTGTYSAIDKNIYNDIDFLHPHYNAKLLINNDFDDGYANYFWKNKNPY